MRRLILFDVDGTLIARGDPDHLAAVDAGLLASFPDINVSIRNLEFDGKVDRQIVRELLQAAGVEPAPSLSTLQTILEDSAADYRRAWNGRRGDSDLLPGVRPLLERLDADDRFALGLLTGGIRGIVETKLKRLGLERFFPIGAFGDEVERREQLLPLALSRAASQYGTAFLPGDVVVVGDTPLDVIAAHNGDVACLAVATGRFTTGELAVSGADAVVPDLGDTRGIVTMLASMKRASAPI